MTNIIYLVRSFNTQSLYTRAQYRLKMKLLNFHCCISNVSQIGPTIASGLLAKIGLAITSVPVVVGNPYSIWLSAGSMPPFLALKSAKFVEPSARPFSPGSRSKACIFSVELAVSYSEFPLQQETVSYGVLPEKSVLPCLKARSLCGPYHRVL